MRFLVLSFLSLRLLAPGVSAVSLAPVDSTPEFESLDPKNLASEIERAEDFFRWHELRESVLRRKLDDPEVAKALKNTEERLRKSDPPRLLHENLELLGFRWWIHSLREDGLARYRANWLFHLIEETRLEQGESLRLILNGTPNPDHAHLLMYPTERDHGMLQGTVRLDPPLSEWPAQSYHLLMTPFAAPLVPYRMETFFIRKKGDRILGRWGRKIDLGWYVEFPK
jgi:hypothetical protein